MAKFVWLKADADFSYFYSDLGTPGGEYVLLSEASERIKVLEDAATLAVDWMRAHADISGVSIYHKLKAALAEVK